MIGDQENIEDIISHFAISLFGQRTADDVLRDVAKNCIAKLSIENCFIYLIDEDRNALVLKAHASRNDTNTARYDAVEVPLGTGIVGSVAKGGHPEVIDDTSTDSRCVRDGVLCLSEITVPLVLDGKVIGIIDGQHPDRNFFTHYHLRLLTIIASFCTNKIVWARVEEKARKEQDARQDAQRKLAEFRIYALRTQINPHFIFNALNSIQSFIVTKNVDQAIRYLSLVGIFIRKVMAASEETLTSLRDEIELLETYFELEKLRFGNKFNYEIKAAPDVDPLRYRIPALLIHLFAATSLNDRFLDEDDPGLLRIAFRKADERLICSINSESQYESSPFDASRNQDIWNKIQERISLLRDFYGMDIGVGRSGNNIVDISLPIVDVRSSDRGNGGPEAKG